MDGLSVGSFTTRGTTAARREDTSREGAPNAATLSPGVPAGRGWREAQRPVNVAVCSCEARRRGRRGAYADDGAHVSAVEFEVLISQRGQLVTAPPPMVASTMATTIIHRKIRIAATIVLAFLLVLNVGKRRYEDVSTPFVEVVHTADAVPTTPLSRQAPDPQHL
jgi:hypothetical protein